MEEVEEANRCCSPVAGLTENQEDTNSSASARPARRRRLARRRQYAKTRMIASSFLRSQFVNYDILRTKFHHEDDWCQTFAQEERETKTTRSVPALDKLTAQEQRGILEQDKRISLVGAAANFSSSSLDSYSLDANTEPVNPVSSPLVSMAKSLSFLHAFDDGRTISRKLTPDRVIRSETIDLNLQSNKSSSATFFPPTNELDWVARSGRQVAGRSQTLARLPIVNNRNLLSSREGQNSLSSSQLKSDARDVSGDSIRRSSLINSAGKLTTKLNSSQCIDNVHFNDIFHGSVNDSSSVTINQSVRTDPRLFKDDVDIKFSRALNSCKLPQIRYASKERLFERLTDLRFLSIDFLNTFLLTYRVFTNAEDVLEALKSVHYNCDRYYQQQQQQHLARESLCIFANSSLNSLSNTNNVADKVSDDAEVSSSEQQKPEVVKKVGKATEKIQEQTSNLQRPIVPPRSPGADMSTRQEANRKLLQVEPNHHQYSKRRSTISALTPIMGSTSSSVSNLNACTNRLGDIQHFMIPHHSKLASQQISEAASPFECPPNEACSSSDQEKLVDGLGLVENEASISGVASGELLQSTSKTTNSIVVSDRARSSSVTNSAKVTLNIPICRQTRAGSLSLLDHNQLSDFRMAAEGGNEHWRLSYKRMVNGSSESHLKQDTEQGPKFQVTLEPPPVDCRMSEGEEADPTNAFRPGLPSTPVEPTTDQEESTICASAEIDMAKKNCDNRRKGKRRNRKRIISNSSSASFGSSSLSNASRLPSSSSETGLTESMSSQEEGQSSSSGEDSRYPAQHSTRIISSLKGKKRIYSKGYDYEKGIISETRRPIRLKEIEFSEAKTIDCDTSADEDKVSTSTGEERSDDDSDNSEVNPAENEEDKSVRLLTRLNSLKLGGRLNYRYSSTSKTEKAALISGKGVPQTGGIQMKSNEDTKNSYGSAALKSVSSKTNVVKDSTNVRIAEEIDLEVDSVARNASDQADVEPRYVSNEQLGQQQRDAKTVKIGKAKELAGSQQSVLNTGTQSIKPNSRMTTPRSSFQQHEMSGSVELNSRAGVVISSSSPRVSSRRSSTASSASAFAAATAASNNPLLTQPPATLNKLPTQQCRHNFANPDCVHHSNRSLHRNSVCLGQQQLRGIHSIGRPLDLAYAKRMSNQSSGIGLAASGTSPSNTPSHVGYGANPHSETSSVCNSRASSRLSSCAGLDYSSHSSAGQANFYTSSLASHSQLGSLGYPNSLNQLAQESNRQSQSSQRSTPISATVLTGQQQQQLTAGQLASGFSQQRSKRNSAQINIRSVATIRVLSVMRHWVSKHSQDFVNDTKLSYLVQEFLQDLIMDPNLLPAEHKAAVQLQQMVQKAAHSRGNQVDLDLLLAVPSKPSSDSIETLSALEIAEGMTYLDHKIFLAIRSEEFLGQAWMKMDKAMKAPHILLITKRFNDVSRLVSSEIIRVPELHRRVAIIEKWTNVAHICRVVHNFNGVLQICAAFTNSAVFRLKKTWDKIPKTTKTTIDQLQNLVSTDSRFRNMRDAINRCDPPSIPYVGMYLTDLSFIEEGTPNYSPDGLLNFSKMRMIAHVIREIQHLQNGSYKIELNQRVANYLLDGSRHLQDDEMYRCSLAIEPRSSGGKNGVHILNSVSNQSNGIVNS